MNFTSNVNNPKISSNEKLINLKLLDSKNSLPLLIQATIKGLSLVAWSRDNQEFITTKLLKHGALVFRDFYIDDVAEFEKFIKTTSGESLQYHDRATPRRQVEGNIYTSTEYPPAQRIFLHNENSFAYTWPRRILFFCLEAPEKGGETPIADVRKVFQRISPEIREHFIAKQVMYVRNFGNSFGLPWQEVFNTADKQQLEEYCYNAGIEVEWKGEKQLRTKQVRPAVAKHPQTQETVWFNHATVLHISTLEAKRREVILAEFAPEDLPNNTYYGDGSEIEPEVLEELRNAYEKEMVTFPWREGDVLMLDNLLTAHGRQPYVGSRQIVVGMAQPMSWQDLGFEIKKTAPTFSAAIISQNQQVSELKESQQKPTFVAPRTDVEHTLVEIWQQVMNLEQIGIHDNFFNLGGQSFEATDIIGEIQRIFQVELPLRYLLEAPTVAQLSEYLETSLWAKSTQTHFSETDLKEEEI